LKYLASSKQWGVAAESSKQQEVEHSGVAALIQASGAETLSPTVTSDGAFK
jgi:hypothetical protein